MAHFKFAVSGQVLDLLTSTKGIADDLYTNSFEFDFRSPEWATCDMKWAHFYNSDYNKIGPNGEAMPYDFNLVDDAISAERGVNLPYGIWEVFLTGNVILNGNEVVQRFVTETQSIWIVQSGVINAEPLGSIEASEVERLSALTNAAYNARITAATARIEDPDGPCSAAVAINGESGTKQLDFVFTGLNNNNKVFWCSYGVTKYSEIVEAVSDGLLPVVLITPRDIVSAGYGVTDDINYIAVYSGHNAGAASAEGTTSTITFTSIGRSKSWFAFFRKTEIYYPERDTTYSWGLQRTNNIDSITYYSSSAKKFYNQNGTGYQQDIVTTNTLKADMQITAGDISYDQSASYGDGTLGSFIKDLTGIYWINGGSINPRPNYDEIIEIYQKGLLPVVFGYRDACATFTGTISGSRYNAMQDRLENYYTAVFYCVKNYDEAVRITCSKVINQATGAIISRGDWSFGRVTDLNSKTYYDSDAKKFYRRDGSADLTIVTVAQLKADMGLGTLTLTNAGSI